MHVGRKLCEETARRREVGPALREHGSVDVEMRIASIELRGDASLR